jgi:hypothetical protein
MSRIFNFLPGAVFSLIAAVLYCNKRDLDASAGKKENNTGQMDNSIKSVPMVRGASLHYLNARLSAQK